MPSRSFYPLLGIIFFIVVLLAGVIVINELQPHTTNSTQASPEIIAYPTRTPTEKEILQDPSKVSVEKFISLAQDTDILHIIDCTPTPFVMRMQYGKQYTIRNNSLKDHSLSFNGKKTIVIKSQTEKTITADFGDPGVYGYGCDTSGKAVGFVVISEKE